VLVEGGDEPLLQMQEPLLVLVEDRHLARAGAGWASEERRVHMQWALRVVERLFSPRVVVLGVVVDVVKDVAEEEDATAAGGAVAWGGG
jgi:hypothetical protein